MKRHTLSLLTVSLVALSGCVTPSGLQNENAELAKQIMVENCIVGEYNVTNLPRNLKTRAGIVNKHTIPYHFVSKVHMRRGTITVFAIKDLDKGWVEVDAAGSGARENFYFNRESGEFACSPKEWSGVMANPIRYKFERTPLISTRIDRLN